MNRKVQCAEVGQGLSTLLPSLAAKTIWAHKGGGLGSATTAWCKIGATRGSAAPPYRVPSPSLPTHSHRHAGRCRLPASKPLPAQQSHALTRSRTNEPRAVQWTL